MIDNEVPKYRKKKPSSTSKSNTKSKHKHEYVECLLICGKIGNIHFFETEPYRDGMRRQLDYDEVYEKYKNLEQIEIEDIWKKYVPINQEGCE